MEETTLQSLRDSDGFTWSKTTHCVVFSLFDPRFFPHSGRSASRPPDKGSSDLVRTNLPL